jgi:hypothetical protein
MSQMSQRPDPKSAFSIARPFNQMSRRFREILAQHGAGDLEGGFFFLTRD